MLSGLQNTSTWAVPKYFSDLKSLEILDIGKKGEQGIEFVFSYSKIKVDFLDTLRQAWHECQ